MCSVLFVVGSVAVVVDDVGVWCLVWSSFDACSLFVCCLMYCGLVCVVCSVRCVVCDVLCVVLRVVC